MAKKVALINMKGGVGKSTLAVNLAWFYTLQGKRVLVVDLDPQFNASQYLLGQTEYLRLLRAGQCTIWDIFERNTRHPQVATGAFSTRRVIHNVAAIRTPSGTAGGSLDVILSRLELAFALKTPSQQKEQELTRALAEVEGEYDLILIDCAPTESVLTTAAYLASDYVLVPVKPEYLSTIGLPLLGQSIKDFQSTYPNHTLQIAGIVFNVTEQYTPEEMLAKGEVRSVAQQNNWAVFDAEVPKSRSFPKSARIGGSIMWTPHARPRQKERFAAFATEFARRIGL